MVYIVCVLLLLLFTSCITRKSITNEQHQSSRTDTCYIKESYCDIREVPMVDSAYVRMYLECDSNGNVLTRELEKWRGRALAVNVNAITPIPGKRLIEIKTIIDTMQVAHWRNMYYSLKDQRIYESSDNKVVIEKKSPTTLRTIIAFIILLTIIAVLIVAFIKSKLLP